MSLLTKILKIYFNFAQLCFGMYGGMLLGLMIVLSKIIKPLRKIIDVYKKSAPIYSSLLLAFFSTSFLLLIFIGYIYFTSKMSPQQFMMGYVISFLLLTPWAYLSLDLFAYYRRYRSDRKK